MSGSSIIDQYKGSTPSWTVEMLVNVRLPCAPKIHCHSLNASEPKGEFEFTWFMAPYKVSLLPLYELRALSPTMKRQRRTMDLMLMYSPLSPLIVAMVSGGIT